MTLTKGIPMNPVLLTNENLTLKTLAIENAAELFAMTDKNRSYLRQWLPWLDHTKSVADSKGFIEFSHKEIESNVGLVLGVWSMNRLVGVCSLQKINKTNRAANIGYWISADEAGKGFARSATKTLMEYAFYKLNIHRIEIRCATENVASQKVAESCGLKFEGISRDAEWLYDHFVSHKIYGILSTDR
jgi:ribosomal-protein-serine acetyltransferase